MKCNQLIYTTYRPFVINYIITLCKELRTSVATELSRASSVDPT